MASLALDPAGKIPRRHGTGELSVFAGSLRRRGGAGPLRLQSHSLSN